MLFRKRSRQSGQPQQEKSLYPVLHVAGSLKEYQQELVKKEVSSLWELSQVGTSFGGVMKEGDQFQAKLQELDQSFANINGTAEQFNHVRGEIDLAVSDAREQMAVLEQTSTQVQQSYEAMAETFALLENAIRGKIGRAHV